MLYFEQLHTIKKAKLKRGQDLQPPLSVERLQRLRAAVEEQCGQPLPWAYCEFLTMTNGLSLENLFIYGDERNMAVGYSERFIPGFLQTNLGFRDIEGMEDYVVFGDDGKLLYTYCVSAAEFQAVLMATLETVSSYASFPEMLAFALDLNKGA